MVEWRYRRGHNCGPTARPHNRRWQQTPYCRYPPPVPSHLFVQPKLPIAIPPQVYPVHGPIPLQFPNIVGNCLAPFPPPPLPPVHVENIAPLPQMSVGGSAVLRMPIPPAPRKPFPVPQFDRQYRQFEDMKRNGLVCPPTEVQGSSEPIDERHALLKSPEIRDDDVSEAMKSFMSSYLPTASFDSLKPSNDWTKEAENLLEELTEDVDFRRPDISNTSTSYELDIARHIEGIKPSPYVSSSPLSSHSGGNLHSSDNDADDEQTSPSISRRLDAMEKAVGQKDIGYHSGDSYGVIKRPTEGASGDSDITSESGFTSSGSSRTSSPKSNENSVTAKRQQRRYSPMAPYPIAPLPPMQSGVHGNAQVVGEKPDGEGPYYKHKAWITDEILGMIAVRDRLYRRMKKHPAPDIVDMYKKIRNMVVGMTRNAKRNYEKKVTEMQEQTANEQPDGYFAANQTHDTIAPVFPRTQSNPGY